MKTAMKLDLVFNDCLKAVADGLLAAAVPAGAGNPADISPGCNFAKVWSYDSGLMSPYSGNADNAAGLFLNYSFQGRVLGTSGAVAVTINPPRAVLVTGE